MSECVSALGNVHTLDLSCLVRSREGRGETMLVDLLEMLVDLLEVLVAKQRRQRRKHACGLVGSSCSEAEKAEGKRCLRIV